MIDLGHVRPGSTIRIPFSSFAKADGTAITMTNFAAADILVYKDGSTTERASTSGYTATTDFDSKTGKHVVVIDLSDNTTADFWAAGSEYLVAIDSVTIDGGATGGWLARFTIGYRDAVLNTTIATLSSQTSFTLASGPAEDDALNGREVIIHDAASAVQLATVLILDYTGSTKTVTLAAAPTFTIAAKDNISIMSLAPLQPTTLGRTLLVGSAGQGDANVTQFGGSNGTFSSGRPEVNTTHAAGTAWASGAITASAFATGAIDSNAIALSAATEIRDAITGGSYALSTDANGRIRIVDGTGAGEIDTSSGAIALVTDITTKTGFRLSATGVDDIWDEPMLAHVTSDTPGLVLNMLTQDSVTLSSDVNLDSIFGQLLDAGTSWSYDRATMSLEALSAASAPSASTIAAAVWDLSTSGHTNSGTFGAAMNAAGSAGDPWATSLPGAYGAGTAGLILGSLAPIRTATAQSGSTTIITLDASASSTTEFYTWMIVRINSGTGAGQARLIKAYNGTTKAASVEPDWITAPSSDSVFSILPHGSVDLYSWNQVEPNPLVSQRVDVSVGEMQNSTLTAAAIASSAFTSAKFAADAIDSNALATSAAQEIRNVITGGAYPLDTDANGRIRVVDGTGTGEIDTTSGLVTLTASQTFSTSGSVGSVTGNVGGNVTGTVASVVGAVGSVTGNVGGNVTGSIGSLATQAKADVNAEIVDAIAVDTYALPGQITPSTTPTLAAAIMQGYQLDTNPHDQNATLHQIYNRAGSVVHQKRTVSNVDPLTSLGALVAGP